MIERDDFNMGTWGVGIYQDDVTCDIKNDYVNRLRVGMSNLEATQDVIDLNMDFIEDEDDGPLFWFALADTQWKYGRLLPEVKERALKYLKDGSDLKRWEENKKMYEKRKKVLLDLENKLNSSQPEEKKVSKLVLCKPHWNVGDVLLYRLKNETDLKGSGFYGKYILLRIVAIDKSKIGSLPLDKYSDQICLACIYNWVGDEAPNVEIIKKLDFIKKTNIFGNIQESFKLLSFSRKELKYLDFVVIMKDDKYSFDIEKYGNFCSQVFPNIYNIDSDFKCDLEEAIKDNNLIDERKSND